MMEQARIRGDFHCHTQASLHAYSTLRENIEAAKRKGLSFLAITDHAIGTADAPPLTYFENLLSLPTMVDNIRILRGAEVNIMNHDGSVDLPERVLSMLDFVVASYHTSCTKPGTLKEHTQSYLRLAGNPYIHMIGHSGSAEFPYDYERVVPEFGRRGKIVEINAHTFICRESSIENCRTIARLCKKHRVPVMVNSDAHSEFEVGEVERALSMLWEIDFPKELIINTDQGRIKAYLQRIGRWEP